MNIFRILGDFSHVIAILILLNKIWKTRSCAGNFNPFSNGRLFVLGVSGKSQILFAIVFITRYVDLLFNFISLYNSVMKLIFIASSCFTVYLIMKKFKATYDKQNDTFSIFFLLVPSIALACFINYDFSLVEVSQCSINSALCSFYFL